MRSTSSIHPIRLFASLLLVACLSGCTTSPKLVVAPPAETKGIRPGIAVLVVEPLVTFENVATQAPVADGGAGRESLREQLRAAGANALGSAGARAPTASGLPPDSAAARLAGEVASAAGDLLRGFPPEEARARLRRLGEAAGCDAVLVQTCQVKLGPGGAWNPINGAMVSAQNSARLRAALIVPPTGEVLWRGEVFLRTLPQGHRLDEAVRSLFASLTSNPGSNPK